MGFGSRVPRQHRAEGHTPSSNSVYIGLVRENRDPQRMGRLLVWISDFGPDLEENWLTVSYASPFAGVTPMTKVDGESDTMEASQKSYGWWSTPPDVDNQVLCCFVGGDTTNGFYFACLYPQNMNHMVPGIGFGKSNDSAMDQQFAPYGPPVVEYNKKKTDSENSVTSTSPSGEDGTTVRRPVFGPLAEGLIRQGLAQDPQRGVSNSSARRESPSHVFGYLSPRGNTIHVDDGFSETGEPENEFIRFRTRSGAQIIIHETSGYIYLITKGGDSWVEISDTGIDMFSAGSISLASNADVNIHAGGAINMHGTTGINMKAAQLTSYTSGSTNFVSKTDFLVEVAQDAFFIAQRNFGVEATRDIGLVADHDILMTACGVISRNAEGILDNSSGGIPEPATRAQYIDGSVTSRVPTHEPFNRAANISGINSKGEFVASVTDSEGKTTERPVPIPEIRLGPESEPILKAMQGKPLSWVAYALATAYLETARTMRPIKEYGSDSYFNDRYGPEGRKPALARQLGNTQRGDGARFCGRGYVQLTGRTNYKRASGKCGVDMVTNPALAMDINHAGKIMREGMTEGWFTGKKFGDYLPSSGPGNSSQFTKARRIINGQDKAAEIAGYAMAFQKKLQERKWTPG